MNFILLFLYKFLFLFQRRAVPSFVEWVGNVHPSELSLREPQKGAELLTRVPQQAGRAKVEKQRWSGGARPGSDWTRPVRAILCYKFRDKNASVPFLGLEVRTKVTRGRVWSERRPIRQCLRRCTLKLHSDRRPRCSTFGWPRWTSSGRGRAPISTDAPSLRTEPFAGCTPRWIRLVRRQRRKANLVFKRNKYRGFFLIYLQYLLTSIYNFPLTTMFIIKVCLTGMLFIQGRTGQVQCFKTEFELRKTQQNWDPSIIWETASYN